jgi:hypothetical protein
MMVLEVDLMILIKLHKLLENKKNYKYLKI